MELRLRAVMPYAEWFLFIRRICMFASVPTANWGWFWMRNSSDFAREQRIWDKLEDVFHYHKVLYIFVLLFCLFLNDELNRRAHCVAALGRWQSLVRSALHWIISFEKNVFVRVISFCLTRVCLNHPHSTSREQPVSASQSVIQSISQAI